MSKPKFTPGPWSLDQDYSVVAADGTIVSLDPGSDVVNDDGTVRANARLISAAPDLVEALKRAVETFADTCDCDECGACTQRHEFETLIAKATGGSNE